MSSGNILKNEKYKPKEWASSFILRYPLQQFLKLKIPLIKTLKDRAFLKQFMIYLSRDFKSKIANSQYVTAHLA